MSAKVTINIPFVAHVETDKNNYAYVEHKNLRASTYGNAAKAKRVLKDQVVKAVEAGLVAAASLGGWVIGLSDGTVFIVKYGHGGWGYAIAGAGRSYASWCCEIGRASCRERV